MSRPLDIVHVCFDLSRGGASLGAQRLHAAMAEAGVRSRLVVVRGAPNRPDILLYERSQAIMRRILFLDKVTRSFARVDGAIVHRSLNLVKTGLGAFLDGLGADLIQFHWVGGNAISIEEIGQLKTPLAWKLPDMWAFSGGEHYALGGAEYRYRDGYSRDNKPRGLGWLDVDRLVYRQKQKHWSGKEFHFVTPSFWLGRCLGESALFGHARRRVIHNPIDIALYSPGAKREATESLGLDFDPSRPVFVFGAQRARHDPRKGYALFLKALQTVTTTHPDLRPQILTFGGDRPEETTVYGVPHVELGDVQDVSRLVAAYRSATAVVMPTLMDNSPNIVVEASCCGIPVVGFNTGGVADLVDHLETGFLAEPGDTEALAEGLVWASSQTTDGLAGEIRNRALDRHAPAKVVERYLAFYTDILEGQA